MLNFYALEKVVAAAMEAAKVPGAALAIIHQRQVIYARGFGVTSIEDGGIPVTPQTIFRIGSTSKPLATTAIMQLVEAGTVELDTPIDEIMPDFELSVRGAIREVTLRKLLSHTAALPTDADHYGSREPSGLREGVYKRIAGYPLVAPVGKIWSYSNPGIDLAGYVAELTSGKPFTQLMQELVFDPLAMKRTTYDPTVAMTYPLAQSHTLDAEGNLHVDHHFADNSSQYPAGFVMSTVLDMANFAIMHLSNGMFEGKQILKPESVAEMHTPHTRFPSLDDTGYGLTLSSSNYKGVRQVGHGGRISSYASHFELVPETGTGIILLASNSALWAEQENILTRYILDNLLDLPDETEPIPVIEPNRADWDKFVGLYIGPSGGMAEIVRDGDILGLVWQGATLPLQASRENLYVAQPPKGDPISVSFMLEGDAPATYATVMPGAGYLERAEFTPGYKPDARLLQQIIGTYTNSIGSLIVHLEGDQLFVKSSLFGNADFPVRVLDAQSLLLPIGLLKFESPDTLRLGATYAFKRATAGVPTPAL